SLRRHRVDHLLAVQRLLALAEHLGGGVDGAKLLRLGRGIRCLGPSCLGLRALLGGVGPGRGLFRHVTSPKTALRTLASRTSRCIESVTYLASRKGSSAAWPEF